MLGVSEPHEEDFGDTAIAAPTRKLLALTNAAHEAATEPRRKVQRRNSRSDVVSIASHDESQVSLVIISQITFPMCKLILCGGGVPCVFG